MNARTSPELLQRPAATPGGEPSGAPKLDASTAQFVQDMVSGRIALPMMPRVVMAALATLRRDDVNLATLATELEADPVLSSRVLRLANSSHFMGRRNVASISDAVAVVGLHALQTLVVACGAQAAFADVPGVNLSHFWQSAVTAAASARQIARRARVDAEAAYAAALLQAVGHLILCRAYPQQAVQVFSSLRSYWGRPLAEQEARAFGVTHPRVSAAWVDHIGMPEAVVHAIEHSLEPVDESAGSKRRLADVVQLACAVTAALANGDAQAADVGRAEQGLVQSLGLDEYMAGDDFSTDFAELRTLPAPL